MSASIWKGTFTRWLLPGSILLAGLCLLVRPAEAQTTKSRTVYRLSKAEVVEVGDLPGHAIGVGEHKGLSFAADGEVGTYSGWFIFDYTNGNGKHEGYGLVTFADGSTQISRYEGTTTAADGGKASLFKGTITYIGGSGRYKGIQGSGTYTGRRMAPLSVGADSYNDIVATYTVPSR